MKIFDYKKYNTLKIKYISLLEDYNEILKKQNDNFNTLIRLQETCKKQKNDIKLLKKKLNKL